MVVAYKNKFVGREEEVVLCNTVLPPTQAMELLDVRTLPSYNKLVALSEEKISSKEGKNEKDIEPSKALAVIRQAVIEVCRQGDPSFDVGIFYHLIRRVLALEELLVEVREASKNRIEFLEFQYKARRRETRKKAIKVLLSSKEVNDGRC